MESNEPHFRRSLYIEILTGAISGLIGVRATLKTLTFPATVMRPIEFPPWLVNHKGPSGPVVMNGGLLMPALLKLLTWPSQQAQCSRATWLIFARSQPTPDDVIVLRS
jgi:hypothetical protein